MHRIARRLFDVALIACAGCASEPRVETLESIIERHTSARGGKDAIEGVRAIEIDLRIVEPAFTVDGSYAATREGRMRIDIFADGERVFTEAFDGARSWELDQGETHGKPGSERGATALRHGIEFPFKLYGLHELAARGHRMKLLDRTLVDGVEYYVVLLTLKDGFEVSYYVNPTTWLIDRERQLRALHVDVDPTPQWIETTHTDYRPVAGVLYPYRDEDRVLDTGAVLSTGTVKSIRVNPPMDSRRFEMPE